MTTIVFSTSSFLRRCRPLTSPSRVAPPTASSLSARTGSAGAAGPRSGPTQPDSRNNRRPDALRDPASSPVRPAATDPAPGVPLASASRHRGDRESLRKSHGSSMPPRQAPASWRHALTGTSPGIFLPRDEAGTTRPGGDDARGTRGPSTAPRTDALEVLDLGGLDRSRPLASLSPRAACPPAPGLTLVDRPDALVLDEPTTRTLTGAGT